MVFYIWYFIYGINSYLIYTENTFLLQHVYRGHLEINVLVYATVSINRVIV